MMNESAEQTAADVVRDGDGERSAFPKWMHKLDPLLEREKSNVLYQAYRLRRTVYRPPRYRIISNVRGWSRILGVSFFWGAIIAAGAALILMFGAAGALAVLLALLVLPASYSRTRNRAAQMPRRLNDVFSPKGMRVRAAQDIWLTGANGATVAEALYLENRERQIPILYLAFVGILAAPVVAIRLIQVFTKDPDFLTIPNVMVMLMSVLCALAVMRLLAVAGIRSASYEAIIARFTVWGEESATRAYSRLAGQRLGNFILLIAIIILLLVFIMIPIWCIGGLFDGLKDTEALPDSFTSQIPSLLVFVLLVELTALCAVTANSIRRSLVKRCEIIFSETRRPYRDLMYRLFESEI